MRVVGTAIPQGEGPAKVTGACEYVADIALPGMLHGKVLRSPHAHARILRIDTSRAKSLPGVRAVITGADLPAILIGLHTRDVPVLATDRVRFIGQKVAAVAADHPETAEQALMLIDVEYDELPGVFDPLEAMTAGAPVLHENAASYQGALPGIAGVPNVASRVELTHGDVEQGFSECDRVFEHTFRVAGTHQGYIEPHACVVAAEADGSAEIWASNKAIYSLRSMLSSAVDVPAERLRVHTAHIGGDFGGKQSLMDVPLAYYMSKAAGLPVKMVMSYTDELTAGNIRHPAVIVLRTGVRSDGRLWAQDARLVYDSGAYAGFKPSGHVGGANSVGGCYRIPNVRAESLMVYTNNVPGGYMRTPGTPQMMFAVESQVDIIARELGLDPLEFRRLNALREGDTVPAGGRLERVRCLEVLNAAASAAGWDQPKRTPTTGRGVALFHRKPGGQRAGTTGHLRLVMEDSSTLSVITALPDQGTGIYTVVRQVIAEVLGLQPSAVEVQTADTGEIPQETGIGGSKSTHIHGQAALQAAEQMRERLLEAAAGLLDVYPEDVELLQGGFRRRSQSPGGGAVQLSFAEAASEALRRSGGRIEFLETYTPPEGLAPVTSFCAQIVEVEVDPETGAVQVQRIVSAHDVGTIINPMFHQGQIDGGVVQALGYALTEEIHIEDGQVLNPNLGEYKMPTSKDIPELITVLLEEPAGPGPFDGKAIGEIPNVALAAAVANAVQDAVGVRISSLPITAEKVYMTLEKDDA